VDQAPGAPQYDMALAALHYPHAVAGKSDTPAVNAIVMQCCCEFLRTPPSNVSAPEEKVIVSGAPERTDVECTAEGCTPCGENECRLKRTAGELEPGVERLELRKEETKVRYTITSPKNKVGEET